MNYQTAADKLTSG